MASQLLSVPFSPMAVTITSPAAVEHVLKTHFDYYAKGWRMREQLGPVFGKGGDDLLCVVSHGGTRLRSLDEGRTLEVVLGETRAMPS